MELPFPRWASRPVGRNEGFCTGHFELNFQRKIWKRWLEIESGVEGSTVRDTSLRGLSTEVAEALGPDEVAERMGDRRARS